LYENISVADMMRMARHLNLRWNQRRAAGWLNRFGIRANRLCGRLSTGQRTQVALAAALGSMPDLLLLDEPLANLDPLVRQEVMAELLAEAADTGLALLLSTHIVAELGGVADTLLLLGRGDLILNNDIDDLVESHRFYVGPFAAFPPAGTVVRSQHTENQSQFLVRLSEDDLDRDEPDWVLRPATVADIVVAHLANLRDLRGGAHE
jgi:ABC-2 type transport system ATP-binding protein